jgi:predicted Fe-Mo cluster-binding NifX family protein
MKVAIASTGNNLNHTIDSQFGHCANFVIYNRDNQELEIRINPFKEAVEHAGIKAVKWLASEGVGTLIAGDFGPKIQALLDQLRIQVIVIRKPDMTIHQIIELLNQQKHATT